MDNLSDIRNIQGKLVCRVDKASKSVEIVVKGCVTVIRFSDDGKVNVTNT